MAPGGGGKRKRGDRTYSGDARDDGQRPSPHRPGNLSMGQHNNQQHFQQTPSYNRDQYEQRGRGRRGGSRGGRGGGAQHSPVNIPNGNPFQSRPPSASSKPTSPTFAPASKPTPDVPTDTIPASSSMPPAPAPNSETKATATILYDYTYISDERRAGWAGSGRKEVLDIGIEGHVTKEALTLGLLFQELIRSVNDGRIDAVDAGALTKEILNPERNSVSEDLMVEDNDFDANSLFLDCLSVFTEGSSATPSLKTMVVGSGISPQQMRCELDSALLESLGMIRNTFVRMGIRQQTNSLYRQSNYNLLREETEGYSKLLTEFFTTSNNEPPTNEVVEETFERVKGMIGAFDLDVGRVLDITLDVFAAVLVKQYRFFVKYLRASSWWPQDKSTSSYASEPALGPLPRWALPGTSGRPLDDEEKDSVAALRAQRDRNFWERCKDVGIAAFFELGGRRVEESTLAAANSQSSGDTSQDDEDHKWIDITKTLPPSGNKVAAQVLGFKLRFYSSSARDPADVLPVNLIYLAALLIKVGFISLRDLYPHIWPADPDMEGVREEKMKEKVEREKLNRPGGGASNALLAAAPLPDDTVEGKARDATRLRDMDSARRQTGRPDQSIDRSTPSAQPEEKPDEQLPEPSEQKVQLLKSLLCIGAIPEALYMLGRFPWLPDAFPELPDHIHRVLHHSISKVYEPLRPLQTQSDLRNPQSIPDPEQSGATKGQVKLIDPPARRTMRWAQLDKEDTNEAIDYKFYWDEWADNIPVCQSVDDVFTLCSSLLNLSGVKVGLDATLLLKIARIGNHSLSTDSSDSNMSRWIDLSKRLIVPALSFTKCNPGVVNEVFEFINKFSTRTRYSIYAEWYHGQTSRLPNMKSAFDQAKAETKDVLKRISKTTLKPMARALAKVAYANPGIVFSVAIAQLESYENIVDAVVECARYFTFLAYDVLTWSLMSALGGTGRNRVQADGMLTSKWLAALSLFAGKVFKRYSVLTPTPVVQYVADQLRRGNSTDLIILEEITKSMAGIISDTNFNEAQVLAMAGGEVLQAQTLLQLFDRRHESKHTAKRLMRSLTESRMAGQILVSLAQERQAGIFRIEEADAHPKLLGNLFDQLHRILVQFLDLLRSNFTVEEFDSFVPDVARLIAEFGIDPNIAFWISRPSINAAVQEYDSRMGKQSSNAEKSPTKETVEEATKADFESPGDVDTIGDAKLENVEENIEMSTAQVDPATGAENGSVEPREAKDGLPSTVDNLTTAESSQEPWHPILYGMMDAIRSALPKTTYEVLGLPFYVTFWQLSLSDLQPPLGSYAAEIERQKKKIQVINSDRSDISIAGTKRKEKEKEAINDLQDRLRAESTTRVNHYTKTRSRILKEKTHWFAGSWGKWTALNVALIEQCFFPRIVMSPLDALYTFKIFTFLHSNGATNFRTMGVLDQLFKGERLPSLMFLCSAKEAENFGRFLNEVLRLLSRWHADRALFEKEAYGTKKELPGFSKKMSSSKTQFDFLDYEDFRRVLLKWHRNLSSAIKTCIGSGEYMHIRNAVNILNNIHQHFPAINWMGQSLLNSITELSKSESREDLKVAAMSLMGALKRREKDWVLPQAFNLAPIENGNSNTNGARSTSAKPSTPRPDNDAAKSLNPKAPDFRPIPRPHTNGVAKVDGPADKVDGEDGEIEDAKMSDIPIGISAASNMEQPLGSAAIERPKAGNEPVPAIAALEKSRMQRTESPSRNVTNNAISSVVSKPDTRPSPSMHSTPPPRPDMGRVVSSDSTSGRAPHNLPSKPEPSQVRLEDYRMPPRGGERFQHDHTREPRYPERGEPKEIPRDRGLDHTPPGSYTYNDERSQGVDRDRGNQRWNNERAPSNQPLINDRHGGSHHRESRYPSREDRPPGERSHAEPYPNRRDVSMPGQLPRDMAMPPPRPNTTQHPINPERAALIQGKQTQDPATSLPSERRSDAPRYDNQMRSHRTSRGPSPIRIDERQTPRYDGRREDPSLMHGRRPPDDISHHNPLRFDESQAPTGPRTGRPATSGPVPLNSSERFRDSMRTAPVAQSTDPDHGRLSNEPNFPSRSTESQYGRLNSDNDIPSGPRMPNGNHPNLGRGGRNVSAPQPQISTQLPPQNQGPPTPNYDRQAPSGPGTRVSPRKPPPFPQLPINSSAPPTPVAQSPDIAGIHPDRLKALQGSAVVTTDNPPQNRGPPRQGPPPVSMPPRGPNNSNQLPSPVGPPVNNRGPPTGPAMPNDRSGRDKRTFAGIQNVLQQASGPTIPERSGQGASIRGRGGRANNVSGPSPGSSAPPTPNVPRPDQLPPREDLFSSRPNGAPAPYQSEEDNSYGRGGRRGGPRDADRRSGMHRNHSPGKDIPSGVPPRMRDDDMMQGRDGMRDRPPRGNEGPTNNRDLRNSSGSFEANIRGNSGGGGPPPQRELRDRGPPPPPPPRDGGRRSGRNDGGGGQYRDHRHQSESDMRDERDGRGARKRGRGGADDGGLGGERGFSDSKRPRR